MECSAVLRIAAQSLLSKTNLDNSIMKNAILLIGLMSLVLSLTCCTKPAKPLTELIQIDIDPDKVENYIDISPMLTDSIDIILLETMDECLLSNIERLAFYKGHYYILDNARSYVFVFDEAGRFVRKIGEQGSGPGEYSTISFFDFVGDSILISARTGFKYIIYNLNTGEPIKDISHQAFQVGGFCLDEDVYFVNNYIKVDKETFNLSKLDVSNGKVVEKYISFDDKMVKFNTIGLNNNLCKYGDSAYVIYPCNDTIYQVTKESVAPIYRVHFTKRNCPDDYSQITGANYYDAVSKGDFVSGLEKVQVGKDYLLMTYLDKGGVRFVWVDRHTCKAKVTTTLAVKKLGFLPLSEHFILDNDLISVESASALAVSLNTILSSERFPLEERYKERLKKLQKNLKEDSNPVLFRYRLKEVSQ